MQFLFTTLLILISVFPEIQTSEKLTNTNWPEELNTAKDVAYLSELEQEVIFELNKVRSNPKLFAEEYLEELTGAYNGRLFTYPDQNTVNTKEGIRALKECIQFLKKATPVSLLKPSEGLSKGAAELMKDQQKSGGIGHVSSKGLNPQNRIEKYGEWDICSSEDIAYGSAEARQIVITLLIDDGVPNRGHRANIMSACSKFVGVSKGKHPSYYSMCVIDYAGEYKSK